MLHSWAADGDVEPEYVLLTAAWMVGLGMLVWVLGTTRSVGRYLSASYPAHARPAGLRMLRWLLRIGP